MKADDNRDDINEYLNELIGICWDRVGRGDLCECILLSSEFAVFVVNATCINMFTSCNFKMHVASWSYVHVEPIHGWDGSHICVCYGRIGTC